MSDNPDIQEDIELIASSRRARYTLRVSMWGGLVGFAAAIPFSWWSVGVSSIAGAVLCYIAGHFRHGEKFCTILGPVTAFTCWSIADHGAISIEEIRTRLFLSLAIGFLLGVIATTVLAYSREDPKEYTPKDDFEAGIVLIGLLALAYYWGIAQARGPRNFDEVWHTDPRVKFSKIREVRIAGHLVQEIDTFGGFRQSTCICKCEECKNNRGIGHRHSEVTPSEWLGDD